MLCVFPRKHGDVIVVTFMVESKRKKLNKMAVNMSDVVFDLKGQTELTERGKNSGIAMK